MVTGLPITFTFYYQLYIALWSNHTHTTDSHVGSTKMVTYLAFSRWLNNIEQKYKASAYILRGHFLISTEKLLAQEEKFISDDKNLHDDENKYSCKKINSASNSVRHIKNI